MFLRRTDGTLTRKIAPYRRLIPLVMRRRNESVVYFDQVIDLGRTLPWLEDLGKRERQPVTVFPLVLAALARVLHERPRLNRFVSRGRYYQRDGVWLSFAAKRRFDDDAPLVMVKRRFEQGENFRATLEALRGEVDSARGERDRAIDREMRLSAKLPIPALDLAVRAISALQSFGVLPRAMVDSDPLSTSAFVANLGSIGIDAAYHHLYERGTCPLFVTVGRVAERPLVVAPGRVEARPSLLLKYSYDERVEDGLYCASALSRVEALIADPAAWA